MDEKGFLIGLLQNTKRIMTAKHYNQGRVVGVKQDGSREFITLIAAISASGNAVTPTLIYKGASHDLQDTWLENYDHSQDKANFAATEKGWTNEDCGLSWLVRVFGKETTTTHWRLLIVDGHSSHVNKRFIEWCDKNRIILAILPPHSTHRLQPLDVGVFSPLSKAYSTALNAYTWNTLGYTHMTKRDFWPVFRNAWKTAVTEVNIKNAFEATGIHPFNPNRVLDKLKNKPESDDNDWATLATSHEKPIMTELYEIRNFRRNNPIQTPRKAWLTESLDSALFRLNIQQHDNSRLHNAIVREVKKRKRGKPIGMPNICPPDQQGQAQVYTPSKTSLAFNRLRELEDNKRQELIDKEVAKAERAAIAIEKEYALEQRKKEKVERQAKKAEEAAIKRQFQEDRKLQKTAEKLAREQEKAQKKRSNPLAARKPQKSVVHEVPEVLVAKVVVGRGGRVCKKPARYRN